MSDEIPEDIMKAAEETLDNLLCNCVESCGSHEAVRQASIREIALAIFSERRHQDQYTQSEFERILSK